MQQKQSNMKKKLEKIQNKWLRVQMNLKYQKKTQNAAKMVPPGVPLSFFWQVLE